MQFGFQICHYIALQPLASHLHQLLKSREFSRCFSETPCGKSATPAQNLGNSDIILILILSSANISKKELCEVIKTFIPDFYIAESEINEDPDKRNYIVSNDKLESLNWFPKVTLEAGIAELLKAYPIIENSNNNFTNL